jgi:2-iminobutanoate/2-iminopropanoate deaminase
MEITAVRTDRAPAPFQGAPYSQAIRAGGLVFVSGQVPVSPETNEVVGETIEEQAEQVLRNLGAILEAAGSGLDLLLKTTILLRDWADFERVNEVYARHVGSPPPARTTAGITFPGPIRLEIDAVAAVRG